ncbi:uncharacterized protein LOC142980052 [Anticarsia gemmatalis]|uniref:uncharacterized protein LOC142980052 n=1 Tax=Anticarsia gemmatalis TaxID=129554 RepID=UPI003F75D4B7
MVPGAMCWKQVSKLQKALFIILFYMILYLVISYALTPEAKITFINDEFRIGDKYVMMFLVGSTSSTPVFGDGDGARVFPTRCGKCFITDNKGFLPMSEYDAVLVHGERSLLTQTSAFMDPGKRYLIESNKRCLRRKFRECVRPPRVTSFTTRERFDLCGLCRTLHQKRRE